MAELAKEYGVNIVGGSVAVKEADGSIANACFVYDRSGTCIARYDKIHLFSPAREDRHFAKGDHLGRFMLDGVPCAVVILLITIVSPLIFRPTLQTKSFSFTSAFGNAFKNFSPFVKICHLPDV